MQCRHFEIIPTHGHNKCDKLQSENCNLAGLFMSKKPIA
jgi:hypothetical protein